MLIWLGIGAAVVIGLVAVVLLAFWFVHRAAMYAIGRGLGW